MPKDYALRKLHSKEEKIIFCGCDAISGLLMHYLLDEPIPDKDIIKEWFFCEPERIITTCWDYERTLKAVEDAQISSVYEFCKYKHITDLPF